LSWSTSLAAHVWPPDSSATVIISLASTGTGNRWWARVGHFAQHEALAEAWKRSSTLVIGYWAWLRLQTGELR
jgi:hypothetical protein